MINAVNQHQIQIESNDKIIQAQKDDIKRQQEQIEKQGKELKEVDKLVCLRNKDADVCKSEK